MPTSDAWDSENFRRQAHATVDMLTDYLHKVSDPRTAGPVLPWVPPEAMLQRWSADFDSCRDPLDLMREVIAGSNHLHHPHYVGHQVTSPLPMTGLFSLIAALLNNGSAVYEMGMVASAMERRALQWMARRLGYTDVADGVLTSGGSAGNLTALLAARQAKAGFDVWCDGQSAGPPLAILVSDQAHYCMKRAAQIMGWGEDGVILIPSDANFRMRTDQLEDALQKAQNAGRKVIAVVASACSTATGAIDPLDAIADFAARHELWFHVDGAHGASFVLAPEWKAKFKGIERADSVVWDAHKMLLTPALITAVIFRQGKHSYESFAQKASYLFGDDQAPRDNWYDLGLRTLECTKNMMGFVLYASLASYGEAFFANYVTSMGKLAQDFARILREAPDFELAVEPEVNIVCFRYIGRQGSPEDTDALQEKIRSRLMTRGQFYLVQTRIRGRLYLRTTLINPTTRLEHLNDLLEAVRGEEPR